MNFTIDQQKTCPLCHHKCIIDLPEDIYSEILSILNQRLGRDQERKYRERKKEENKITFYQANQKDINKFFDRHHNNSQLK